MIIPVLGAVLIFGGFVLADKYRNRKPVNVMGIIKSIDWVKLSIDGKDYLVGRDYYSQPLSTGKAVRIAKANNWIIPTPRMVDAIWEAADLKVEPITAGNLGETNKGANQAQYDKHAAAVAEQLAGKEYQLVAGNSKDIVYIPTAFGKPVNKLGIYGWHRLDGTVIQKEMWGHGEGYEDYSQKLRPVKEV